jgi:hypothetical protein
MERHIAESNFKIKKADMYFKENICLKYRKWMAERGTGVWKSFGFIK